MPWSTQRKAVERGDDQHRPARVRAAFFAAGCASAIAANATNATTKTKTKAGIRRRANRDLAIFTFIGTPSWIFSRCLRISAKVRRF
jgi:hypothetical protein